MTAPRNPPPGTVKVDLNRAPTAEPSTDTPPSSADKCGRCDGKGYEPPPTGTPRIGAPSCMACFGSGIRGTKAREADAPFSNPDLRAAWAYGWNSCLASTTEATR